MLAGLADAAGTDARVAGKIVSSANSKAIVALVWKAGYSMELAVRLQQDLPRVGTDAMIGPGADGGFPLEEEDLKWELYFHGIV